MKPTWADVRRVQGAARMRAIYGHPSRWQRARGTIFEIAFYVALVAIFITAFFLIKTYLIDRPNATAHQDCTARGGHPERIHGGHGGWVCEGTTR